MRLAQGETLVYAATATDPEDAIRGLADAITLLPRGTRLQVFVSGAICRPFLIPAVEGARDAMDWAAIAATLVEGATGLPSDSLVWMDDGQSSPRFAVAMHPTWQGHMQRACGSMVENLKPWWVLAVDQVRSSGDSRHGLAVFDSDALVLLVAEGGTYLEAQAYPLLDEDPDALLRRALITHDLSPDALDVVRFHHDEVAGVPVNAALPFSTGEAA
ncbi:hypothetical protein ASC91_25810 [Pelomonas sp. Root1237]|nr:hypothetical protein ASC91_25810 [Pelomonas sp. Root1237]